MSVTYTILAVIPLVCAVVVVALVSQAIGVALWSPQEQNNRTKAKAIGKTLRTKAPPKNFCGLILTQRAERVNKYKKIRSDCSGRILFSFFAVVGVKRIEARSFG